MSKLTLSVEAEIVSQAKEYAKAQGVSVSDLVGKYLSAVARPSRSTPDQPVLRALRGVLKDAHIGDHRAYLANKYK